MTHEHETQVAVDRCVSIMVFYHDAEQSPAMKESMVSEVQAIAHLMGEFNLGCMATEQQIILPVESKLLARFGPRVGELLHSDFLQAFQGLTLPDPLPVSSKR